MIETDDRQSEELEIDLVIYLANDLGNDADISDHQIDRHIDH